MFDLINLCKNLNHNNMSLENDFAKGGITVIGFDLANGPDQSAEVIVPICFINNQGHSVQKLLKCNKCHICGKKL